jgi:hypothetical protein
MLLSKTFVLMHYECSQLHTKTQTNKSYIPDLDIEMIYAMWEYKEKY